MSTPSRSSTGEPDAGRDLLKRYRTLCEASGIARANRLTLATSLADELAAVEEHLLARLGRGAAPATPSSDNAGSTTRELPRETPSSLDARRSDAVSIVATVFTDGSAEGNPGPGGYCALVRIPGLPDRELSGGTNYTTNNKMELMAAIVGLRTAIDAGATRVTVVSDSEYLIKGMTRWLEGWLLKDWKTSDGLPVKNRELWEQLDSLSKLATIHWQWIRGHAGHSENERCDEVAAAAARKAAQSAG